MQAYKLGDVDESKNVTELNVYGLLEYHTVYFARYFQE